MKQQLIQKIVARKMARMANGASNDGCAPHCNGCGWQCGEIKA